MWPQSGSNSVKAAGNVKILSTSGLMSSSDMVFHHYNCQRAGASQPDLTAYRRLACQRSRFAHSLRQKIPKLADPGSICLHSHTRGPGKSWIDTQVESLS